MGGVIRVLVGWRRMFFLVGLREADGTCTAQVCCFLEAEVPGGRLPSTAHSTLFVLTYLTLPT